MYYNDDSQLIKLREELNPAQRDNLERYLSETQLLKFTPVQMPNSENKEIRRKTAQDLELNYQVLGDTLRIDAVGRIDTLGSPELLGLFEEVCGNPALGMLGLTPRGWTTYPPLA